MASSRKHRVCAFCGGDAAAYGGRLGRIEGPFGVSKNTFETVFVHTQCAVWSPNISQNVDLTLRSVGREVRRARNLKCSACGRNGAAIGCRVPSCSNCYHLPCAISKCCSFNHGLYLMACPEHATLFKSEPNGQAPERNGGPLAHLKLSGSHHQRPRCTTWADAAGNSRGLRKRSRMTATQIGNHIDAVKAAYQSLVEELSTQDGTEPDDAIIAAKDAKRLKKATQQLAPTYLGPGSTTARGTLKPFLTTSGQPQAKATSGIIRSQQQQHGTLAAEPVSVLQPASAGFASIGGLHDVKRQLKEMVLIPLMYPDLSSKLGIQLPRGILLHGPPGTGKTAIVRALAAECSRASCKAAVDGSGVRAAAAAAARPVALFARKGTDCLGKYAGDAELHLRLLFEMAAASAPSIIFFDEMDGLVPARSVRSSSSDQIFASVVSVLLALMDGLNDRGQVMVIGATNRPDSIDPALRRPGRFDREVYFNLPTQEDRQAILSVHTNRWQQQQQPSQELLQQLAAATDGWAGADLQSLTAAALMSAVRRTAPNLTAAPSHQQPHQQQPQHHHGRQLEQAETPAETATCQQHWSESEHGQNDGDQHPEQRLAQTQVVDNHGFLMQQNVQQEQSQAAAIQQTSVGAQPGEGARLESQTGTTTGGSRPLLQTAAVAVESPKASSGFLAALNSYVAEQQQQRQQYGTVTWLSPMTVGSPGVPESVVAEAVARAAARASPAAANTRAAQHESKHIQSPTEKLPQSQQQEVQVQQQAAGQQRQALRNSQQLAAVDQCVNTADIDVQQPSQQQVPCKVQQQQQGEQAARTAPVEYPAPSVLDVQIQAEDWWRALRSVGPPASKREMQNLAACNPAAPLPAVLAPLLLPAFAQVVLLLDRWLLLLADGRQQLAAAASTVVHSSNISSNEQEQRCLQFEQLLQQFAAVERLPEPPLGNHSLAHETEEHASVESAAAAPTVDQAANTAVSGQPIRLAQPAAGTQFFSPQIHSLPRHSACHGLLLSGHGAAGQSELAASVMKLLDSASAAAVYTLSLPGMLLLGDGNAGVGLIAGVTDAVQRAGRGQLMVLYLPRIELWALEPVKRKERSAARNIGRTTASNARVHSLLGPGLAASKASAFVHGAMHGAMSSSSSSDDDSDVDGTVDNTGDGEDGAGSSAPDPNNVIVSGIFLGDSTTPGLQRPLRSHYRRQQRQQHKLSAAWGVFEQQVSLLPSAGQCVLLLATSHIAAADLPVEVQQVFNSKEQQQQGDFRYTPATQSRQLSGIVQTCGCCSSSDVRRQQGAAKAALHQALMRAARAAAAHYLHGVDTLGDALKQSQVQQHSRATGVGVHKAQCSAEGQATAGTPAPPAAAAHRSPLVTEPKACNGQQQHEPQLSLQQFNAAQQAQAHQLFSQVQHQLQALGSRLLADPAIRRAGHNPPRCSSRSARNARQRRHSPRQILPLAAVCMKAIGGCYAHLDEFQADFAAAVDDVRAGHAGDKCYSSAVAAAVYMQDVADTACLEVAQQLKLYDPWNRRLILVAAHACKLDEQQRASSTAGQQQEQRKAEPIPATGEATATAQSCDIQYQAGQMVDGADNVEVTCDHARRKEVTRRLQSLAAAHMGQWQRLHMRQELKQSDAGQEMSHNAIGERTCWTGLHTAVQRYCVGASATARDLLGQPC